MNVIELDSALQSRFGSDYQAKTLLEPQFFCDDLIPAETMVFGLYAKPKSFLFHPVVRYTDQLLVLSAFFEMHDNAAMVVFAQSNGLFWYSGNGVLFYDNIDRAVAYDLLLEQHRRSSAKTGTLNGKLRDIEEEQRLIGIIRDHPDYIKPITEDAKAFVEKHRKK